MLIQHFNIQKYIWPGRGMNLAISDLFYHLIVTALPLMQFLLSGERIHPEGQAQEKKSGPDEESKQRWLQGDDAQELIPENKKGTISNYNNISN